MTERSKTPTDCRVIKIKEGKLGVVRTAQVQLWPRDSRDALLPYKPKEPTVQETGVQCLVLIVPAEDMEAEEGAHTK